MIVEMGKKYKMANGVEYRLLATDADPPYPVVGLYRLEGPSDEWKVVRHTLAGASVGASAFNLVEIKPSIKGEFWIEHYDDGSRLMLSDYPLCHQNGILAITHHTYDCEEGDGLK